MSIAAIARRQFLGSAIGASALALAGCNEPTQSASDKPTRVFDGILGLQLYTVRELFEKDARATLNALAEIGYKDCETAGLFEHDPKDVRMMMDDLGLVSRSAHIRLPALRDGLEKDLEIAETLGQDKMYLGWIPEEERTLDKYRALADLLNARGEETKAAGIQIGYHNHEFEFIEDNGTTGYDILLDRTDSELVTLELDFFWAHLAKVDPVELFNKAPGRFTSCHIKDSTAEGEMVPVGDGVIDFTSIFEHAQTAGMERFYVEHDNPQDALASLGRSFASLTD
ncbi:MAG: sugar phosphate isomerase/epimerase [Erythrobacter sp.]|uniref:sugar phosphate isomerase/epimerase family protein n=1 Tax=Erythrobacter sp. TaxID=1042 RepID=UPI0032672270